MTDEELREFMTVDEQKIFDACLRATPGPWTSEDKRRGPTKSIWLAETAQEQEDIAGGPSRYGPSRDYIANFIQQGASKQEAIDNAAFAALARSALPTLLRRIATMRWAYGRKIV